MLELLVEERTRIAREKLREEQEALNNQAKKAVKKGDEEQDEYENEDDDGLEKYEEDAAEVDENKKTYEQELYEKAYIKATITDNDNGSYKVVYQVPEACKVSISIKLKNERGELQPIRSC